MYKIHNYTIIFLVKCEYKFPPFSLCISCDALSARNIVFFSLETLCMHFFPYFSKDKHLFHFTYRNYKKDKLKTHISYSRVGTLRRIQRKCGVIKIYCRKNHKSHVIIQTTHTLRIFLMMTYLFRFSERGVSAEADPFPVRAIPLLQLSTKKPKQKQKIKVP